MLAMLAVMLGLAYIAVMIVTVTRRPQTFTIRLEAPPRERVRLITDQYPDEDLEDMLARHKDRARTLGLDDRLRWVPERVHVETRPTPSWRRGGEEPCS